VRMPFPRRRERGLVRQVARGLAVTRAALGVAIVAAPDATTRRWLGTVSEGDPGRQVAVRSLGARDVVLGIGTLAALRSGNGVRQATRWLEAGIVADLADAASTALAEDLDAPRTFPVAVALGAAGLGVAVRSRLR
jgi:hypothetical protein